MSTNVLNGPRRADLHSTLLIASPKLSDGKFLTLTGNGPLMMPNAFGGVDVIDVVALECNNKDEIKNFITALKEEGETLEETPITKNVKDFCTRMLQEIASGTYEHEVPKYLMQVIERDLRPTLRREQLMYLSGVTRIEN